LSAGGEHPGDPSRRASAHLIGLSGHNGLAAPQVTVGPFSYRDDSARGGRTVTGARTWEFSLGDFLGRSKNKASWKREPTENKCGRAP
jgi:hypothetical protein